ncbi:MAG: EAL domain-containing protein [Gammaproteobacteria bacterium]|nr:EAL domain-containing protein [Gammaproteobacteria bacterium]
MAIPEIVATALAVLATALGVIVWIDRRRSRHEEGEPATAAAGAPAPAEPDAAAAAQAVIAAMREPALVHGESIETVNPAFADLVGIPVAELRGRRLPELVAAEYSGLVAVAIERALTGADGPARTEAELTDSHGQVTRLELEATPLEIAGRRLVLLTAGEMLPRGEPAAPALPAVRAVRALEFLGEGLVTTDATGRIDYQNPAAEKLTGIRAADAVGQSFGALIGFVEEHDRRPLPDPVQQCLATGTRVGLARRALLLVRATGAELGVEATTAPIRGDEGELAGTVVLLHDVTEQRGLARQMSYQAAHDPLTGLVNRREFERRLGEALETARSGRQNHVLCYLDLDRFKAVNDSSGHVAGDNLLREVAVLIREAVRDSDTVGRIGGDEFGVLLVGCPLDKARQIADDIWRAIGEYRFVWKDRIFNIGVSVGLVEITRDSSSIEEALNAADSACYVAKRQADAHVHVYSAQDEVVARSRGEIHWLQRLQVALRDGLFELFVQPIEATRDHADGPGCEVLVRLRDDGQTVAPAEFFPAAGRYRLLPLIDRWVLNATLGALAAGALRLPPGRSVALNVSGQTLGDPGFLEYVVDELDRSGVAPALLCFEVAETAVVGNLEHARRFVEVLHGMGCQFALDDFGNDLGGFTSLRQMPMNYLKIDGSFIRDLARNPVNQAVVTGVIGMARTLGFRLIAEQVEDAAALEAARGMGIDFVQGYAIGRPRPLMPG